MAYIQKSDLYTHIYQETIDKITRANDAMVTDAINVGIIEAQGYLSRFDLVQLFGNGTTAPTVTDANLMSKVKDLICWHLINLCNVNVDYERIESRYKYAIKYFNGIQSGDMQPPNWPYFDTTTLPAMPSGDSVAAFTMPKRGNNF